MLVIFLYRIIVTIFVFFFTCPRTVPVPSDGRFFFIFFWSRWGFLGYATIIKINKKIELQQPFLPHRRNTENYILCKSPITTLMAHNASSFRPFLLYFFFFLVFFLVSISNTERNFHHVYILFITCRNFFEKYISGVSGPDKNHTILGNSIMRVRNSQVYKYIFSELIPCWLSILLLLLLLDHYLAECTLHKTALLVCLISILDGSITPVCNLQTNLHYPGKCSFCSKM
jgi:hypothetical protein